MCEHLVMTCRPTLLVLIGLTLLHGTSSAICVEEPLNRTAQKQTTIPDVMFLVNQTVSTIEATAEEVKQLKKRLDGMDVLLKSSAITEMQYSTTDKPVEKEQTEKEFFLFTEVKLQDVPNITFKLNSAPPHWSLDSWDCLNEHFPKNWFEAYEDCRIKGMALASIENDEDHWKLVQQIIAMDRTLSTNEGDFWLSGTDLGHEGKFVWMSTGRPLTEFIWIHFHGQSDHSRNCDESQKEHCIEISQSPAYGMNDWCCEKRQNYICERRKINQ